MAGGLLQTKLYVPQRLIGRQRHVLISRPHLIAKLNVGLSRKLTFISAPAGFGKTTLVASHVAGSKRLAAWLSLDKDDNREERFLRYLIAALQETDQAIGVEAAQLIMASRQAPPEAVLISLINDLDTAGREISLVLDDYHLINSQAVHSAVAFLLDHCPSTFHLVIITRSDPPLPLARLRARGQMVELRAADLRFTEAEAAQFLNDVMGLHLDAGSVSALAARTEGWVASLQLAALALQGTLSMHGREDVNGFIEGFSGTNRYILDYLLEEVMASQPPEIMHFLLKTSILRRLTTPLCDAVLADDEDAKRKGGGPLPDSESRFAGQSASTLEYLERANLFLLPLDNERIWYRYHHLFADMLHARLQQAQPDVIPLLHIRASAWLEQSGLVTEAIHHLFAAGEIDQAADLIERYGPAYLADSDPSVLQMADRLPREALLARPKIGLHRAWHCIVRGNIEEALPLLNDLARELAGTEPKPEQRWMQTVNSLALAFLYPQANMPESDPLPDYQLLDEIPAEEHILRNAADFLYGMTLGRRGELDRAAEFSVKSIKREKTFLGTQTIPTLAPFLTRIYLMQGRLHAAASLCREFLNPIKELDIRLIYTAGSMKIDLGEVLYEWNFLEEAEQHIRAGLEANEIWQNIMTDGFGLVALTRVLLAKGDYAGAMQVVKKFETKLRKHARPREFDENLHTLRVRVQLAGGDLQNPSHWAEQILLSEDFALHEEYYRLTLARVYLTQGRYGEVEKLLAGTVPPAAVGSQIARQLEFNLLLATAVAGQQRLPEAFELIESCLAMAEPEGYIRAFLDIGEPVRELLAAYLQSSDFGQKLYAQKVLEAFPPIEKASSPAAQPGGLIEPISERELEVLHIMALGKTNKEIARQLVIAPGTVKAHTASIYRKLDVANRTEAVARARELGILP